jgi:hypothetical protein
MKNETKKSQETQGDSRETEKREAMNEIIEMNNKNEQERMAGSNPSQTIKQLGGAIKNLKNRNMATEEELTELKKMYNKILQRWIGGNLFE